MYAYRNSVQAQAIYKIIPLLFVVFSLLTSCGLVIELDNHSDLQSGDYPNRETNTEFIAYLLSPLADGQSLALDVVDELRGLPNNIIRYQMTKMDDLTYHVVISGVVDTTMLYRYSRVGESTILEVNSNGDPVKYRLYHFEENTRVEDIITGWIDGNSLHSCGEFSGRMIDRKSKLPVADVLISISGQQFFTNINGEFFFANIPEGSHNFVAASIDGSYQVFQQYVTVASELETSVLIELESNSEITVTFEVTTPVMAEAAILRLGGNLYQLGNTYADLNKGLSLQSSRMPKLTRIDDQKYFLKINLFAGSEIRYFYTLGDGFWNVEQGLNSLSGSRQIILPDRDVTIQDEIAAWQMESLQAIQISVKVPKETPANDYVSIQFRTDEWFEPIPMWKDGNTWKFSLFSPIARNLSLTYRFCRNNVCDLIPENGLEIQMAEYEFPKNIILNSEIIAWKAWKKIDEPTSVVVAEIPRKPDTYLTGVEFSPEFNPSYLSSIPAILDELMNKGINTIVLQPTMYFNSSNASPYFLIHPGDNMLQHDIREIISACKERDLEVILSPKLITLESNSSLGNRQQSLEMMMENRDAYKDILLSYAQLSGYYQVKKLIINPFANTEINFLHSSDAETIDYGEYWEYLVEQCKGSFSGDIVLSIPYSVLGESPRNLLNSVDALYVILDQPLVEAHEGEIFPDYRMATSLILNNELLFFRQTFGKPIYIGFSIPPDIALATQCQGTNLINCEDSVSISSVSINLPQLSTNHTQVAFYNAVLGELIGSDLLDGVINISYFYPLKLSDQSSSINGKPAMDVLWYWYTGVK